MKKVLIVCHDYKISGANMALLDWISKADKQNFKYTILLPRYNEETKKLFEENDCKVIIGNYFIALKHKYRTNFKEKIKNSIKWILSKTINKMQLIKLSKALKNEIDLIHSNSFSVTIGCELAKKMKVPHLWHIREFMEEDHKIQHYNKRKIQKLCDYSYAIYISKSIEEKYKKMFNYHKSNLIYDNVEYAQNYLKTRGFMEDGICNILIAGIISQNKGQFEAVKAIEKLNEIYKNKINLFICGEGPEREKIEKYLIDNNINNIHMKGYIKNLPEFRKNIDIALVCSKSEAFGRVTVEGMYYENLVIGTNAASTKEIINDGQNGLLYNINDINDLMLKIKYSMEDKSNSIKIISNAKKEALCKYNVDIYEKIEEFYDIILDNHNF